MEEQLHGDLTGRSPRAILLLSTANFDAAVWTNKQFLASKLAADRRVYYVNSLGLRAPGLNRADAIRALKSLTSRIKRTKPGSEIRATEVETPNLTVINPTVLPFHKYRLIRILNRKLLLRQLHRRVPQMREAVLWTFSPMTYGLEQQTASTVYHSVDLLHTLDRVPEGTLLSAERRLLRHASHSIASSSGVLQHLATMGAIKPQLWENVADVTLFDRPELERSEIAIFAGNLTPQKIDINLLWGVVARGIDLVIAGPIDIDGTSDSRIDQLLADPNVKYLGRLTQQELALQMNRCTVGLIPYTLNDYTAGVFPLKVYEYLAAGLHVVATPLPSLQQHSEEVQLTSGEAPFVNAVAANLKVADPDTIESRKRSARDHSWESRMAAVRSLLDGL